MLAENAVGLKQKLENLKAIVVDDDGLVIKVDAAREIVILSENKNIYSILTLCNNEAQYYIIYVKLLTYLILKMDYRIVQYIAIFPKLSPNSGAVVRLVRVL